MFRWIITLILLTSAVAGCSSNDADKHVSLIRKYNEAAVNAYRTGDMKPLESFAGEKELRKVWSLVDIKRSNGLVLESQMQKLELLEGKKISDTEYMVRTKERWTYYDRPMKAGLPPGKNFVADMVLTYTLKRDQGEWKVEKIKAEKTDYLEGAPERR